MSWDPRRTLPPGIFFMQPERLESGGPLPAEPRKPTPLSCKFLASFSMAHFHLMHCIPDPRMHGLNGYREVIETVGWGLEQLGHHVTYAVNEGAAGATHIVFGAQVMPIAVLAKLPPGTIIYNFEQLRDVGVERIRGEIRYYAQFRHFTIWDYSAANLPSWRALRRPDVKIVPVGYAPILSRIPKASHQDIDVLLYGLSGERRLQTFHGLSQLGLVTLFVSGLYGAARDDLISRAKVVLNVNLYAEMRIFEIVRVSYLLANRKAVVADLDANTSVEDDVRSAVRFASTLKELLDLCAKLVSDEGERNALEERGLACISRRDIRGILERAL